MIRKMVKEDYNEVKEIFYEVHYLHLENRPDIYKDGDPLPTEIFNDFLTNYDNLNYVYIKNSRGFNSKNFVYTRKFNFKGAKDLFYRFFRYQKRIST